jgi:SAM-dependent methyltransferase
MANDYDSFAEAYAAETESNLINGYYTRPAILDLAGDVAGRRILDVGCGAGPLLESLRDRGASVTGVEPSAKMLELERPRIGGRCGEAAQPPQRTENSAGLVSSAAPPRVPGRAGPSPSAWPAAEPLSARALWAMGLP